MRLLPLSLLLAACSPEAFLSVRDDPPTITIVRPVDLAVFDPTQPVEVCAQVDDDGPEEALTITIESSRQGALAPVREACEGGNVRATATLDPFAHVLVVTAIDERGQSAAAAVTIVPEDNLVPFCAWRTPTDGVNVPAGVPLLLSMQVGDPDNDPSTLAFELSSSRDGVLLDDAPPSSGAISFTTDALSEGLHQLQATVVDPRGLIAACPLTITVDPCVDLDGDGVTTCAGDCNDADTLAFPDAPERPNGRDDDCDTQIDENTVLGDDDLDGYTEVDGDCDDADPDRNPGELDVPYDGFDADCSGTSDFDADGDGFDAAAYGGADCNDADALISPLADETWYDGVDQDCAGDDDFDQDRDGAPALAYGGLDCDDTRRDIGPTVPERWYDGVDQDCSGGSDNDADQDGEDAALQGGTDCDDTDPNVGLTKPERWYDGVDQDCSGGSDLDQDRDGVDADFAGGTDCADLDPGVFPGAFETWYDGVDQDCSGGSDYDQDADGQATSTVGGPDCDDTDAAVRVGAIDVPYDGVDADCAGGSDYDQDGDGFDDVAFSGTDCDDLDPEIRPGARERWYDGVDQDCDGGTDFDQDADGFTRTAAPDGSADDCDDARADVAPGAPDAWYDGVDADCAGNDDYDQDGDGQRTSAVLGPDCNDLDPAIRVGVPERWYDNVDQDCSGGSDHDQDRDGFTRLGAPDGTANDCDDSANGFGIKPGASEVWYDGIDQDCSGGSDYDRDRDGYDSDFYGGRDCNDGDNLVRPGASERRNGFDDDCDGGCDEGLLRAGDLVISEVMRNPDAVDDTTGEWFEVHNPTGTRIVMCSGWEVVDDGIDAFEVLAPVSIPAGGYAVFARSGNSAVNGGLSAPAYAYGGTMALSNGADTITLAFDGVEIDYIAWSTGWPNVTGASMELDRDTLDATSNDNSARWCAGTATFGAGDKGSPGRRNDGCP